MLSFTHNGYRVAMIFGRYERGPFTALGIVRNVCTGFAIPFTTGEHHATASAALRAGVGWIKKTIDGVW